MFAAATISWIAMWEEESREVWRGPRLNDRGTALGPAVKALTGFSERVFVPIEKLSYLTGTIPKLLPPGTRFGFNHDGEDRAWVFAGTEDLADYVALALERESGTDGSEGNAN